MASSTNKSKTKSKSPPENEMTVSEISVDADQEPDPETASESSDAVESDSKAAEKVQNLRKALRMKTLAFKQLFLGKTKKQMRFDKQSYIGKRMLGPFIFFFVYAYILFAQMDSTFDNTTTWGNILYTATFRNPYVFGTALTYTYIELALLFCNDKILKWIFEEKHHLKLSAIFFGLLIGNFFLAQYINLEGLDQFSFLLIVASLWMLLQSVRLYSGSRAFATRLETKWTNKYSLIRYFFASITPFVILGFLTFFSLVFRYYSVIWTLDLLGPRVPGASLNVYSLLMHQVMPMLYLGLILVFMFMMVQTIQTRKMGHQGAWDNLAFGLITFMMFMYALYNVALYLFLNKSMIDAISLAIGSTGQSSWLFVIEFAFSMIFFIWILLDLTKQFKTGFLFFTSDGLAMLIIGTIVAQTTSRLGLLNEGIAGTSSEIAQVITYDHLILPILIILFLGGTILIYYMRPREVSMFMHVNESAINKQDKSMETILKFLKREFIRRGDKYEIEKNLIEQIRQITALPAGVIWSLIHRLDDKYMDVQLIVDDSSSDKRVFLDFIPITERYQKDHVAEEKANTFMRERFTDLISKPQRKRINLDRKNKTSSSQQSYFIQALSVQYGRKYKDEEAIKQNQEKQQLIIDKSINADTKDLILTLIRQEYINRIEDLSTYPTSFFFRISDIARKVEKATKVSPGRLYPLLNEMAVENWNFNLSADITDKESKDDKQIEFLPIDDFELYEALKKNRPEATKEIDILMQTWFDRNIHFNRSKDGLKRLPPQKYANEDAEFQRSFYSRWFANTMEFIAKDFIARQTDMEKRYNKKKIYENIQNIKIGQKQNKGRLSKSDSNPDPDSKTDSAEKSDKKKKKRK